MTIKKTAVKTTAKRAVKKVKAAKNGRALVYAAGSECFWTTDGKVLSNLLDLRDVLRTMSDEVFSYHVTKDKNDFADWVHIVLHDTELALLMRKSRKAKTTADLLTRRLKIYSI